MENSVNRENSDGFSKDIFFYASDKYAKVYDDTIDRVVPYYHQIQNTLFGLVISFIEKNKSRRISILDVGAGSGRESIPLLKYLTDKNIDVDLKVLDPSSDMLKQYQVNLAKEKLGSHKVQFITESIFDYLPSQNFDIILSAYTIHHFTKSEKLQAYEKIFKMLDSGGLFINIDLYSYYSDFLTNYSKDYENDYIKINLGKFELENALINSEQLITSFEQLKKTIGELNKETDKARLKYVTVDDLFKSTIEWQIFFKNVEQLRLKYPQKDTRDNDKNRNEYTLDLKFTNQWLRHYEEDNLLEPIEWQLSVLRTIGFDNVGCPFIFMQNGMACALKRRDS